MLKPLPRETLTVQATDTLRRFILTEELGAGFQLPSERELSEILSVSRNIVREALSVLVAEKLIVTAQGGESLSQILTAPQSCPRHVDGQYDGQDLSALAEARAVVELGAVDLMTERIRADQFLLTAINKSLAENLSTGRSTIRYDIDFHTVLFESTHNAVIIDLIPLLVEFFRLSVMHRPMTILHNAERIIDEHQRIIDALKSKEPAAVRDALVTHLYPTDMSAPVRVASHC